MLYVTTVLLLWKGLLYIHPHDDPIPGATWTFCRNTDTATDVYRDIVECEIWAARFDPRTRIA